MIKTEQFTNTNDFLIAPENAEALSCRIGNTGVTAGGDGKKIIKAGTPLYVATGKSIFTDRDEVMTTSSASSAVLQGIARHDYDVTDGTVNGAVLYKGTVDLYKLDSTVQTLITSTVTSGLPLITFIKGAK